MDIDAFRAKLGARKKQMKELENQLAEEGRKLIVEAAQDLFSKYPELEMFGWNQGQYYNDEYYSFRLNIEAEDLIINNEHLYNLDGDDQHPWKDQAAEEIHQILKQFGKNDFKRLFGENAKVVVNKQEILIEEYDPGY